MNSWDEWTKLGISLEHLPEPNREQKRHTNKTREIRDGTAKNAKKNICKTAKSTIYQNWVKVSFLKNLFSGFSVETPESGLPTDLKSVISFSLFLKTNQASVVPDAAADAAAAAAAAKQQQQSSMHPLTSWEDPVKEAAGTSWRASFISGSALTLRFFRNIYEAAPLWSSAPYPSVLVSLFNQAASRVTSDLPADPLWTF